MDGSPHAWISRPPTSHRGPPYRLANPSLSSPKGERVEYVLQVTTPDDCFDPGYALSLESFRLFPLRRIHRLLRKGNYAERVGAFDPVYLATVMEYLAAEVLELEGDAARDNKNTRIIPRHLQLTIRNDEELNALLSGVTIAQGGFLPNTQAVLLPKKTEKKA
ncbi:histone H2A, sperm-like [Ischnura elegans]|uniref:histone H2A, sperm-like n=1 Tax=Ischnura elegans TaxID=197161 RepID=UPI001ED89B93|nr:histone H2A, sperm-like [Ischnura elegans]